MDVKLTTEKSEIIASGSVIIPNDDYVQFELEGLKFRFVFILEQKGEDSSVTITKRIEKDNNNNTECLSIIISNVKRALFGSLGHSMQVATIDNKNLSIRFSIVSINRDTKLNSEDKILFYTWYLAKNPNNINNN